MGNTNQLSRKSTSVYVLSKPNLKKLEQSVLEFSGLPEEEFVYLDVKVGCEGEEKVTMRTIQVGRSDAGKPKLVWLHGYGSASALYYKVMKKLSDRFQLYFVDLIGMGGSSRPADFDRRHFGP